METNKTTSLLSSARFRCAHSTDAAKQKELYPPRFLTTQSSTPHLKGFKAFYVYKDEKALVWPTSAENRHIDGISNSASSSTSAAGTRREDAAPPFAEELHNPWGSRGL